MITKEWLNRGYRLDAEIDQLEQAKATMRVRLTSATPSYEAHGGTSSPDPHKYDKYAEYCFEIDKRIDELYGIKQEIQSVISKVEDTKLRALLIARYINFETFDQIAVNLGYDLSWVMRLHKKALNIVEEILNKP